jgi:predicted Rossmann-fold nucleotide-binding protein
MTLRQLGYHEKPILLADFGGFWQGCRAVFEHFVAEGFAEPGALRLYELVPDMASMLARLEMIAATHGPAEASGRR